MDTTDHRTRRRGDRGFTLIEVLVAVALTGTIVLAVMGGMWAVVRTSNQNDERARVQAVLGAAADRILNYAWNPCPEINGSYSEVGKAAAPSGWPESTVEIVDYRYWNPTAETWDASNSIDPTECDTAVGRTAEKKLQKITVRVTTPDGEISKTLDIIKSDIRPQEVKDASAP